MQTVTQFHNKCPDCICRRAILSEDDPMGEVYKPLLLVWLSLRKLVASIETVTTEEDFLRMRQELEVQHGVKFFIQWTGSIQVNQDTPGLCKRTRGAIQKALDGINPEVSRKALETSVEKGDRSPREDLSKEELTFE